MYQEKKYKLFLNEFLKRTRQILYFTLDRVCMSNVSTCINTCINIKC